MSKASGRLPPHDLSSERAVLSASMLDRQALDEVLDIVRPEHFYAPAHQSVWESIQKIARANDPVDIVTVNGAMKAAGTIRSAGGSRYLAEIIDTTPATANVRKHAANVIDLWRLRSAIAVCQERAAVGYESASDVIGYLDKLEQDVVRISQADRSERGWWQDEAIRSAIKRMNALAEGQIEPGVLTGYEAFDELTGGFHDGDFTVLAARPGMGKTAFSVDIGMGIAQRGGGVAMFSLEMPKEQIVERQIASVSSVPLRAIKRGRMTRMQWNAVTEAATKIENIPMWVDDSEGLSVMEVRGRARRKQAELSKRGIPLRLVIIDYLQLMRGDDEEKGRNREQEVSGISRGLKGIAKCLNVPVLALSSLNRQVEQRSVKKPMLSDLRESGSIEADADVVMFLYREGYYAEQQKEKDMTDGSTELIVAKQRNGPTFSMFLKWRALSTRFDDDPDANKILLDRGDDQQSYPLPFGERDE